MSSTPAASRTPLVRLLMLGIGVAGCPGSDRMAPAPCTVNRVTVQVSPGTLVVGEFAGASASVDASNCAAAPAVTWSSGNPGVVAVSGNGNQATLTALAPTAAAVAITATAGSVSGSAQVTVQPGPEMAIAPGALTFTAAQGTGNPVSQFVTISNSGGGLLSGLAVGGISYGPGGTGWLQPPTLSNSFANPSATLTVQPVTGALLEGVYTAVITIQAAGSSNTPQQVSVSFAVTPPPPTTIALSTNGAAFQATTGGPNPAALVVTITNGGGGTLSELALGPITYGPGATGWLQVPALSATTAAPSATFALQPVTGGLAAGVYTASIAVVSPVATNSPQSLSVTFTLTPPPPAIVLAPTSLAFGAVRGGLNPPSQLVTITNGGEGTLGGLSIGPITYGPGATGWLQQPVLSGTTANPSVTFAVQPVTGTLAVSTYTATIRVFSPDAPLSPIPLTVNFTVNPAGSANPCLFDNAKPIMLGQPLNGALIAGTSCLVVGGFYVDHYLLQLSTSTRVLIDHSAGFDTYLRLFDFDSGELLTEDDDGGPGLNSRIARELPAGRYIIQARTFESNVTGQYFLHAQEVALGPPASVAIQAGNGQKALPGSVLPVAPAIIVRDANGFGVPGVSVAFATVPSVGSITGNFATTNAEGIATVGSWTIAAGPNVLSATLANPSLVGNPVIFSATGQLSPAGFNAHLRFLTMPTLAQLNAFGAATARWQAIITSDIPDIVLVRGPNTCAANAPALDETVDDLLILVSLVPIDGPNGVLGSAGACIIRNVGALPVVSVMRFDVADLAEMEAEGALTSLILHEMGHALGIGSLWKEPEFNLVVNPSLPSSPGVDTHYSGVNGIAGFDAIGGLTYTGGAKVPLENTQGGGGSRDSHWRESVLDNELLTGFLDVGPNPLSILTVRSLEDLGYTVDTGAADPFFLTLSLRAPGAKPRRWHLQDDVYQGPILRIDAQGRVTDREGRPMGAAPGKR